MKEKNVTKVIRKTAFMLILWDKESEAVVEMLKRE